MRRYSLAVLAALLIGGCADEDASNKDSVGSAATPADASAAYIAEADAICREANEKERALGAEGPGWMYSGQFDDAKFLADFNAIARDALRELKALTPPAEDREKAEAMTEAIDRMADAINVRIKDLRAGRTDSSAQLKKYEHGYTDLAVAAGPLGLSECQGLLL